MYGTPVAPCPEFDKKRIHAPAAYRLAASNKVPWNVLQRADDLWRHAHPNTSYSGSYHALSPSRWFDHELGLITTTAIASHLIRAHNKNRTKAAVQCLVSKECQCDEKLEDWEPNVVVDSAEIEDDLSDGCISIHSGCASRPPTPAVSPHS